MERFHILYQDIHDNLNRDITYNISSDIRKELIKFKVYLEYSWYTSMLWVSGDSLSELISISFIFQPSYYQCLVCSTSDTLIFTFLVS